MAKSRRQLEEEAPPPPPKRRWLLWGGLAGGVFLLIALSLSFWIVDYGPGPEERFRAAIEHLEKGDLITAHDLALGLHEQGYRDPTFAGGAEFVLGMVEYKEAEHLDEQSRLLKYDKTISWLREAAHHSIDDAHRPEWSYVLGTALHFSGRFNEARALLEDAVAKYPSGRVTATFLLIETYLHGREPGDLEQALRLSNGVVNLATLPREQRDRCLLQRAQVLYELGQKKAAEESLQLVSKISDRNDGLNVLRAQTFLADGNFQQAQQILEPATQNRSLERSYARQATLLLGVCAERLGDRALKRNDKQQAEQHYLAAITAYKQTVLRYEREHEALAAWLYLAALYRRLDRTEEAFEAYRAALTSLKDPNNFRNRWLSLDDFRSRIIDAWEDWVSKPDSSDQDPKFPDALRLSELMEPLFSRAEALQFEALSNQRWAEYLDQTVQKLPYSKRQARLPEVYQRWIDSGEAFTVAATARQTFTDYSDTLWTSAEHLFRGHAYRRAIEQYTLFLDSGPTRQVAMAWLQRGHAHLNLDEIDKALEHFQRVLQDHPTDPVVFETRYLIGICQCEQQNYSGAEKTWRGLLNSPELTPTAREWMLSLYSLARLQGDLAERYRGEALAGQAQKNEVQAQTAGQQAFNRWDETISLLEQFLDRYPDTEESIHSRYLLAKSWQRSSEWVTIQRDRADNDNARRDFASQRQTRLENALAQYHALLAALRLREEAGQLTPLDDTLFRNSLFEYAHLHFWLNRFEEAIDAYSIAANRFQDHPSAVMACIQMVECYQRLNQHTEARSMLELARRTLEKLPDSALQSTNTNLTRAEWNEWLVRAGTLRATQSRFAE